MRFHARMRAVTAAGVAVILLAMLAGPFLSVPGYSSVAHSLSQLAAQGQPGARIMRAGFVAYGLAVALAGAARLRDVPLGAVAMLVFGLGIAGTGVWSHRPIVADLPFNALEDQWHSRLASGAGIAFCLGTLAFAAAERGWRRALSLGAAASAVLLPAVMFAWPAAWGLPQRLMFTVSFVWVLAVLVRPVFSPSRAG
jgi:hypothetical protein